MRTSGLATHYIPSRLLPEIESRLRRLGERRGSSAPSHAVSRLPGAPPSRDDRRVHDGGHGPLELSAINRVLCELESEAGPLPDGPLVHQLPWIRKHFGSREASVGSVIASLRLSQGQLKGQQGVNLEANWVEETLTALAK